MTYSQWMLFYSTAHYYRHPTIDTSKYHVSCTNGKISLRIKLELPFSSLSHSIVVFFQERTQLLNVTTVKKAIPILSNNCVIHNEKI